MSMLRWTLTLVCALLVGCGAASNAAPQPTPVAVHDKLRIEGAFVRPAPKIDITAQTAMPTDPAMAGMDHGALGTNSSVGGAYFTIRNTGPDADTLLGATTDAAEHAELHVTVNENNIARMVPQPNGIAVPANGTLEFTPGNYHLMLVGLKQSLTIGMQVRITLRFARNGDVQMIVPVQTGP